MDAIGTWLNYGINSKQYDSPNTIGEDDNDLAELVTMHLRFQGQEVCRVASIGEARSVYKENHFDLVVLDRGLTRW